MKKVFTGWLEKNEPVEDNLYQDCNSVTVYCASRKGKKAEWSKDDWPPKKVTITIEVEK